MPFQKIGFQIHKYVPTEGNKTKTNKKNQNKQQQKQKQNPPPLKKHTQKKHSVNDPEPVSTNDGLTIL